MALFRCVFDLPLLTVRAAVCVCGEDNHHLVSQVIDMDAPCAHSGIQTHTHVTHTPIHTEHLFTC